MPARISEFHALTWDRSTITPEYIILRPNAKFISKNHSSFFSPSETIIRPLTDNKELCPVANFHKYKSLVESISREKNCTIPTQIWVSEFLKPLSKLNMRSWFRELIFSADPSASIKATRFHSIRGTVASALDYRAIAIVDIIKAMNWKNDSTFKSFYAKLGIASSIPCVLAGITSGNKRCNM